MPISDQNLSSLFLNEFVDCALITCCGNNFKVLQIRTLKNVFQVILAHLGMVNFIDCPLRLYVYFWSHLEKLLAIDTFLPLPCQYLICFS